MNTIMRLTVTIFVGYFFMGIGKFQATDKYLDRWFISFLFFLNTDGWNHTNFGNSSDFGLEILDFGLKEGALTWLRLFQNILGHWF